MISRQTGPEITELECIFALSRAARSPRQPVPASPRDDRITPETIPPERLNLASAEIRYLSAIIGQLIELRNTDQSDDHGTLRASPYAFDIACHLLVDAAILSAQNGRPIPRGCASTDSQGGIRMEWIRPGSGVHVVIPHCEEGKRYLYHELGEEYGTVVATPETLAKWLNIIE